MASYFPLRRANAINDLDAIHINLSESEITEPDDEATDVDDTADDTMMNPMVIQLANHGDPQVGADYGDAVGELVDTLIDQDDELVDEAGDLVDEFDELVDQDDDLVDEAGELVDQV